jgi:hypothetical protein
MKNLNFILYYCLRQINWVLKGKVELMNLPLREHKMSLSMSDSVSCRFCTDFKRNSNDPTTGRHQNSFGELKLGDWSRGSPFFPECLCCQMGVGVNKKTWLKNSGKMDSGVVIKMFLKDAVSISELCYVCSFLRGLSRLLDWLGGLFLFTSRRT